MVIFAMSLKSENCLSAQVHILVLPLTGIWVKALVFLVLLSLKWEWYKYLVTGVIFDVMTAVC